jgi:hypothetical protein
LGYLPSKPKQQHDHNQQHQQEQLTIGDEVIQSGVNTIKRIASDRSIEGLEEAKEYMDDIANSLPSFGEALPAAHKATSIPAAVVNRTPDHININPAVASEVLTTKSEIMFISFMINK